MKKNYIIICIFLSLISGKAIAQYTKLLELSGANGSEPFGALIMSDHDTLYSTTSAGGSGNGGTVLTIKEDGSGFYNMHDFTPDPVSGSAPVGSLMRSGNILYGMTSANGAHGVGTIFSINTDGSNYTKLYDFVNDTLGSAGGYPLGTLVLDNGKLYGTTYGIGWPGTGNVFSIYTNGSGYSNLHTFNGTDGEHPGYGALVSQGNILYGTTLAGGTNGDGVFFSIDTEGTYTKLHDFNSMEGIGPSGLIYYGGVFYGTTGSGGLYGKGTIFSMLPDTSGFTKLFDFNGANGSVPIGSLVISGSVLYGTTSQGGATNDGTLFSINTDGSGFQTLYNFSPTEGFLPSGPLTLNGTILYGTTTLGGVYNHGVLFSFETHPAEVPICMVTVDDSSLYNHVIWQKPVTTDIDSFFVFRETTTNNYEPIGGLAYADPAELIDTVRSLYFPFTGDPNAGTYRYKIKVKYITGSYSLLSPYHNTLFITQTGGTFNWSQYEIEDQSSPLPSLTAYVLYRDDNSTGAWHAVGGVSGTQTTISDPNYASFPNAKWRVEAVWTTSCSSTETRSNIRHATLSDVEEKNITENISIYPNPSGGLINLYFKENTPGLFSIKIFNLLGENVYENKKTEPGTSGTMIDLSFLPAGVYYMEIKSDIYNEKKIFKIILL